MMQSRRRKISGQLLALGSVFALGMVAGVAAYRAEALPYRVAKAVWVRFRPSTEAVDAVPKLTTELAAFERVEFLLSEPKSIDSRGGGGIATIPGGVLGVDKWGSSSFGGRLRE